jgi:hypothetical protein
VSDILLLLVGTGQRYVKKTRKLYMPVTGKRMRIDRTDEIAVAQKATGTACTVSILWLMMIPTCRTLDRCASFGGGRAQDASDFDLVGESVDICAVLTKSYAQVMMASLIPLKHAMWVAYE